MSYFSIIMFIVTACFGVIRQAVHFQNEEWSWFMLRSVFFYPYWMIYGEIFKEEIDSKILIFFLSLILSLIINSIIRSILVIFFYIQTHITMFLFIRAGTLINIFLIFDWSSWFWSKYFFFAFSNMTTWCFLVNLRPVEQMYFILLTVNTLTILQPL